MQRMLTIFIIATVVAIIGHATHWFGVARPAINKVDARVDATNAEVAAQGVRVAAGEKKIAETGQLASEAAKAAQAAAEANRATQGDVAKLAERVDANSQAIGDIKAQIAAATPSAEEQLMRRDLINAMTITSQFKAAIAESMQTEGRAPADNAKVGLSAPDSYADGSLTRIAIEHGIIVASFKDTGSGPTPRFRLIPSAPGVEPVGIVRWKCDTNMALAAKLFATCELKI